jgi:Type IX secretion system protein PorV
MNRLSALLLTVLSTISFLSKSQGLQGTLIGQDSTNKVITTAVPFLTITPDSRAAGMAEAGVATSADANSAYWNAGKLAFIDKEYGVSASYTPWLGKIINDMSIFYLTGFYKISREQTVAASMKYFDLGEIQFKDIDNNDLGRFNPREFAFDVTYSRMLTEQLSIGGALRYIHSNLTGALTTGNIDARPGNSVAVDFGIFYTKPLVSQNSTLSLGAAITNLGAKISYSDANNRDFIPTNLRMGGAYKIDVDPKNSFTFAMDLNKLMVPSPPSSGSEPLLSGILGSFTDAQGGFQEEISEFMLSIGTEYWYNEMFAGRLGYFNEAKEKGNRKYITGGVGFRAEKFGLDVAYLVPVNKRENALAETIRFTLFLNFENKIQGNETVTD